MRFMVSVEIPSGPDGPSRAALLHKLGNALHHSTAQEALCEAMGCEIRLETAEDAAEDFFDAIESTGGVTKEKKGWYVPIADKDWIDLGEAYVNVCAEFGREPMVDQDDDEENDD